MSGYKHVFLGAFVVLLLITGCNPAESPAPPILIEPVTENKTEPEPDAIVRVWSYFDLPELEESVKKEFPTVDIEIQTFEYENFTDAYIEALVNGTAPDVMVIDNGRAGYFNTIEGLDNLLDPPYNAGEYWSAIPEHLRGLYRSFKGGRFIAVPMKLDAAVTLYRADIMEQYGFPSEPDELTAFIKDADNLVKMAETLKKDGKYIFTTASDPVNIVSFAGNILNEELAFTRTSPAYGDSIELARIIQRGELSLQHSIWSEQGKAAVQEGRVAMLFLGQWGVQLLQEWSPETKGKWRMAQLPFGVYGFAGGSSVAVSSQSRHKELAWEVVKRMTSPDLGVSEDERSPFLGGQNTGPIISESLRNMKVQIPTPFDHELEKLWWDSVNILVWSEHSIEKEFTRLEQEVERIIGDKRKFLLQP
ncbi:ABC transporter substrate-binding protein [Paenibacillus tarimensis]